LGRNPFDRRQVPLKGGVISPILANIALNGLEECVRGSRIAHYPIRLAGPKKGRKLDFVQQLRVSQLRVGTNFYEDKDYYTSEGKNLLVSEYRKKVYTYHG
jgi:retron-type reverse transcriptase